MIDELSVRAEIHKAEIMASDKLVNSTLRLPGGGSGGHGEDALLFVDMGKNFFKQL